MIGKTFRKILFALIMLMLANDVIQLVLAYRARRREFSERAKERLQRNSKHRIKRKRQEEKS